MADCTVGAQAMHEAVGEAQTPKKKTSDQDLQKTQDFCTKLHLFALCKRRFDFSADIEATGL